MWPPSLNKPPKRPHFCCSLSHWRAQDVHQNAPKPHKKLLAQQASHRVCGHWEVVMWFQRGSLGDLMFCCISGSPPHMCHPYPLYQGMTPSLMCEAIKEAQWAGFIVWRAPVWWKACRSWAFTHSVWGCGQRYAVLVVVQANWGFMRSRLGFLPYLNFAPPTIVFRYLSSALIW